MGTNKDCEDFATAACSIVNAILQLPLNRPWSQLTRHVIMYYKTNVKAAYVTSGWVQINIQNYNNETRSSSKIEGHAWCTIQKNDNTLVIAECTTPILPHSDPKTAYGDIINIDTSPFPAGYGTARPMPIDRYKAACFMYNDSAGYALLNSQGKVGVLPTAPKIYFKPLSTPQDQKDILWFREIDHNPDFSHPVIKTAFQKLNLHTKGLQRFSSIAAENAIAAFPAKNPRFIPLSEIKGDIKIPSNQPITLDLFKITDWCILVALGTLHSTSITFTDNI